ncbi:MULTISPECIES: single-stranded-DNA-specific exonuclease RecJ [Cyanophyceae]|uniref:single-stranded-DNA-specific exonuclease RecJ n=1 Tax=Cyanophyceae TaxID=3028117 RepID=UPI00016DCC1A|nr:MULTISPECIES: single-stranded-DNA-specific exonuclease RecJ [Cyanophyceae]ACA99726.1 single-strand-DNA-specific exonuclease [Picosynechococcus sp. PCC 7002]SMH56437.1 putative exonuclease, RecJ-like [Picosynechococcus sp. OG1]SMQ83435.1 putative exonuclease, RecJ-like [Synechococcus sp. 7002]
MNWQVLATPEVPDSFIRRVEILTDGKGDRHLAQLLWQRGFNDENTLAGFLNPEAYAPTSAFAFGQEMKRAIHRLIQAKERGEKVAIWGDFDADGVTATSVLWEGLGQFFSQETQLIYYIPNRLTESHGLNNPGIDRLKTWGASLIIICDTGSTNLTEIAHAKSLDIDLIITDHHTLPETRPDVLSIINPRYFAENHPLFHLSGVAVAYKLVEALSETLPDPTRPPVTDLLDLVAIGLIADLVALKGDCRYLAQVGIQALQKQTNPKTVVHPGIKALLDNCHKTGDRPTDISFGIGPRINAVSRIYGDASFCVELLTSRERGRCGYLAQQTELANARRKEIQQKVVQQAKAQIETLDLSTTSVLVLCDAQWQGGVLGLVASQIAQTFGRPTILLTYDPEQDLWKGSARSAHGIDLYDLVQAQGHLLHRFGGHPFAAGLSVRPENLAMFKTAINQQARQQWGSSIETHQGEITIDLVVAIADLGESLFQSLECLEPFGMGNPKPKLLIKDCGLTVTGFSKLRDKFNRKLNYFKTNFELWDETDQISGIWWGGHPDDLTQGAGLDVVVELDRKEAQTQDQYFVRLLAVAPTAKIAAESAPQTLLDFRHQSLPQEALDQYVLQKDCPVTWQELYGNYQQAIATGKPLALHYASPTSRTPEQCFKTLIGIAKYVLAQDQTVSLADLKAKLHCGDRPLDFGLKALKNVGFVAEIQGEQVRFQQTTVTPDPEAFAQFKQAILEEQFQRQYFAQAPLTVIQATLEKIPV